MPNLGILLRSSFPVICYNNDFYRWNFVKEVFPFISLKFAAFRCLFIPLCSLKNATQELLDVCFLFQIRFYMHLSDFESKQLQLS